MTVFRKGTGALPGEKSKSTNFFNLKGGQSAYVVPMYELDEGLVSADVHEIWEVNPMVAFPCIGVNCPGCKLSIKKKFKAYMKVVAKLPDEDEYRPMIWPMGIQITRQIGAISEESGKEFAGLILKVSRTGQGLKTQWTVIPTPRRMKKEDLAKFELNIEPEEYIGPTTADAILSKLKSIGMEFDEKSAPDVSVKETGDDDWAEL